MSSVLSATRLAHHGSFAGLCIGASETALSNSSTPSHREAMPWPPKQKRGPPLAGGSPLVASAKRRFVGTFLRRAEGRLGDLKCIVHSTEMMAMSAHL